jgi:hypothetical protein
MGLLEDLFLLQVRPRDLYVMVRPYSSLVAITCAYLSTHLSSCMDFNPFPFTW